jgi:thiaminase
MDVASLVAQAQGALVKAPNRFLDALEAGTVSRQRLRVLAGELYWLVDSDGKATSMLAYRFPDSPLFAGMASGESEALRLLLSFASALDWSESDLRAYEPLAAAQAYPAFIAQTAAFGQRSAFPLALLVNVSESGGYYARAADALVARYEMSEEAVAHFRYFAETPDEALKLAAAAVEDGLSEGDDPVLSLRAARLVHEYEAAFWAALAG